MGAKTGIEWTDATWTPIRARTLEQAGDGQVKERIGWHCERVSEACRNCYAEPINKRLGTGFDYKPGHLRRGVGDGGPQRGDVSVFLDEKMLLAPLRWKAPRMIFVCSMTDLFADFVQDEWIDRMFAVMALCPQHTFQVLTKRPERMLAYLTEGPCRGGPDTRNRVAFGGVVSVMKKWSPGWQHEEPTGKHRSRAIQAGCVWPLPNVWLGVSAEDQPAVENRVPVLLATPAAVRFVSVEPMLGPVDLSSILHVGGEKIVAALSGEFGWRDGDHWEWGGVGARLDWVICGGESGPGARPMHPDWARSLRDQCAEADVPFFFKQWGVWTPSATGECIGFDPDIAEHDCAFDASRAETMARVGKKAAGRLLDGVLHDGVPS